jgi:hypothetical protein
MITFRVRDHTRSTAFDCLYVRDCPCPNVPSSARARDRRSGRSAPGSTERYRAQRRLPTLSRVTLNRADGGLALLPDCTLLRVGKNIPGSRGQEILSRFTNCTVSRARGRTVQRIRLFTCAGRGYPRELLTSSNLNVGIWRNGILLYGNGSAARSKSIRSGWENDNQ